MLKITLKQFYNYILSFTSILGSLTIFGVYGR